MRCGGRGVTYAVQGSVWRSGRKNTVPSQPRGDKRAYGVAGGPPALLSLLIAVRAQQQRGELVDEIG